MLKNAYKVHSIAFVLMLLSSAGLYLVANAGALSWIWVLLGLFVLGNVLVLLVK
jgi:hypothetical protein